MQGRHRKPSLRVRAEAKPLRLEPILLLALILFALVTLYTKPAAAAPMSLLELEARVWTAEDRDLPALEREVVRLIQISPRSAHAHHLLSHIQVRNFTRDPGDLYLLKQASDMAQQAIDLEPRNGVGYVAMADIMDLMGNGDRALRLLDEAEAGGIEPNWRFYFTRARLLADNAGAERILGLLETAMAFTDSEPRIIAPYVVALLQTSYSGTDLIAQLKHWQERFPSPVFALTMAITYAETGNTKEAHALYRKMIANDPEGKEARINDAILLYRDMKQHAKAVKELETILATQGSNLSVNSKSMVLAHLAAAQLGMNAHDAAADRFLEAVGGDPGNTGLIDFMTRTYREAKAYDHLVRLLRRINDRVPGTGVLHALLAETLSDSLARHDEALRSYADAIILEPDRSDYYTGMGLAFYRKRNLGEALKLFTTATEVNPNDATARYNEACVLALLGRSDEAMNSLAEALTLDPNLAASAKNDMDFASVKGSLRFQELVRQPVAGFGDIGH